MSMSLFLFFCTYTENPSLVSRRAFKSSACPALIILGAAHIGETVVYSSEMGVERAFLYVN
jgi:hypothetical protein